MAPETRPRAALVLALLLLLAPLALAGRPTEAFDPAHDVAVHENAVFLPVDSIDLLHARLDDAQGRVEGVELRVVDLSRAGWENVLFTRQHAHTLRTWGAVALLDDGSVFTALAVKYDPPLGAWDEESVALRVYRDGTYEVLDAAFTRAVDEDAVSWRLAAPFPGRAGTFAAIGAIAGCDPDGTCEGARGVAGFDAVPDSAGRHVVTVVPSVWWEDVFPEQQDAGALDAARDLLVEAWGAQP